MTEVDRGLAEGLQLMEKYGKKLAADVRAVADCVSCGPAPEIIHKRTVFRWKTKKPVPIRPRAELVCEPDGKENEIPLEVLVLGELALVGEKPEVCFATEQKLREQSPFRYTVITEMVNGGMKYMPDRESYDRATWEAMTAKLMPGAAECFLETAREMLQSLRASHPE